MGHVSMHRAYSLLRFKAVEVDGDQTVITGIATTPEPDRVGDVVEPKGVRFTNPLPLLLFHDAKRPVGSVKFQRATDEGIEFEATLADPGDSATLKERIDEARASIQAGLIRGVSIGFRALEDGIELLRTGGYRFTKTEVFELSLVVIPANASAMIQTIKSIDAPHLAALGEPDVPQVKTPGASGIPAVRMLPARQGSGMKTYQDQILGFEQTRKQKADRLEEIQQKASAEGRTKDEAEKQEFDALKVEIKGIDAELVDLREMQDQQKAAAVPVQGHNADVAQFSRGSVVTVKENTPPGVAFARMVMAKVVARLDHRYVVDVVKEMFPGDARVLAHFQKANVAAGSTTNAVNAAALVDPTNLTSEFIEFLRPATIIGKFGTNGIPSLTRVPFNIRVTGQTTGGTGYWVGEGKPKPLTNFEFNATTLAYTKVAAISVITQELARFSTPSAELLVRNGLRDTLVERIDIDFIDPGQAASSGVNPASITNGLTAGSSAGTSADNVRTDIQNLIEGYLANNQDVGSLVLIMPNTLALVLSFMVNTLGQREFPDMTINGGTLLGIPVIASQYAANASGSGNLVIAVNAREVFLADDGEVTVDMSTEASLQMLDNPTNDTVTPTPTTMVSLWQTNSIGLRAERFINWQKRRSTAVSYLDDVNWGGIGSPA